MKTTAFTEYHIDLDAKMVPFAGYNMPVEYFGITDEHITVRERLGVFDVSHMGEFMVTGPDATAFLQYITSNDVEALFDGKVQYSCFPNGQGGSLKSTRIATGSGSGRSARACTCAAKNGRPRTGSSSIPVRQLQTIWPFFAIQ